MENASYIALSRQMALIKAMDAIANNIANASTSGYKGERLTFAEHLVPAAKGDKLAFVSGGALHRDMTGGSLTATDNSLDVAIEGEGFFVVDTPLGRRYTRNGDFRVDDQGRLITAQGHGLSGEKGAIIIPAEARDITIKADGTISTESGVIDRFELVEFTDPQRLRKVGNGLYKAFDPPRTATAASLVQGARENSNVVPVLEISNMINVLRNFQANQKMIETEHNLQRRAIERITRAA